MKVIIAGGRDITDFNCVRTAYEKSGFIASEIVSGGARGVDYLGELLAKILNIPTKVFPADWNTHGRKAGPIRNGQMTEYAEALIAIWDGESKGTANMISQARSKGLEVFVYLVGEKYDRESIDH